jgi:hypothetical protein
VTQVVLDRSRVMAGIGQGIAAGMAEHVDVNLETDRGFIAQALDVTI